MATGEEQAQESNTNAKASGGWANTGMAKDGEELLVPRKKGTLLRRTVSRSFRSQCECGEIWDTTGAIGGGCAHASKAGHTIKVYYYAEYEYVPTAKAKAVALRAEAARIAEAASANRGLSPAQKRAQIRQELKHEQATNTGRFAPAEGSGAHGSDLTDTQAMDKRIKAAASAMGIDSDFTDQVQRDSRTPIKPRNRRATK